MKAYLTTYTQVLGVPRQYESVALMLKHKMDFYCCANRDSFCKSNHIRNRNQIKFTKVSYTCIQFCGSKNICSTARLCLSYSIEIWWQGGLSLMCQHSFGYCFSKHNSGNYRTLTSIIKNYRTFTGMMQV